MYNLDPKSFPGQSKTAFTCEHLNEIGNLKALFSKMDRNSK